MVIVEAWPHGKPVLMTPACNLPEGLESRAAIQIAYDRDEIVPRVQQLEVVAKDRARVAELRAEIDQLAKQIARVNRLLDP